MKNQKQSCTSYVICPDIKSEKGISLSHIGCKGEVNHTWEIKFNDKTSKDILDKLARSCTKQGETKIIDDKGIKVSCQQDKCEELTKILTCIQEAGCCPSKAAVLERQSQSPSSSRPAYYEFVKTYSIDGKSITKSANPHSCYSYSENPTCKDDCLSPSQLKGGQPASGKQDFKGSSASRF